MDKYRAEVPEYEAQDDEEIFTHLINGDFNDNDADATTDGDADGG